MDDHASTEGQTAPWFDDGLEALARVDAPDTWSQAILRAERAQVEATELPPLEPQSANDRTVSPGSRSRVRSAAMAAVLAIAAAGLFAFSIRTSDTPADIAVASQPQSVALGGSDQPTESGDQAVGYDDECATDLAQSLTEGAPIGFASVTSDSPEQLALLASRMVRGSIVGAEPAESGSWIFVIVEDGVTPAAFGPGDRTAFWTQGSPPRNVSGRFVAFLDDTTIVPVIAAAEEALGTFDDGLWVACDDHSPAASVHSTPVSSSWDSARARGISLDDLWALDLNAESGFESAITTDLRLDEGYVFDLGLLSGDRFRLVLPAALGTDLSIVEKRHPSPIEIRTNSAEMRLHFEVCDLRSNAAKLPGGAIAQRNDDQLLICRQDQLLELAVSKTDTEALDARQWDILPVTLGRRYGPLIESLGGNHCSPCHPAGPHRLTPAGQHGSGDIIVVRRDNQTLMGLNADDLTVSFARGFDDPIALYPDPSGQRVLVAAAGTFLALDPVTGDSLWEIDRSDAEGTPALSHHVGVSLALTSNVSMMRTSFASEATIGEAPVLRRFDLATGDVTWQAAGRPRHEWGPGQPLIVADTVITFDTATSLDDPDTASTMLYGFDLSTGQTRWTRELAGQGPYRGWLNQLEIESGPIVVFDTNRGDLIRLDPQDGSILWQTTVGDVAVDGTTYAPDGTLAIAMGNQIALSPVSGEVVIGQDMADCRALIGPNPWITLFAERKPGCVLAASFQRIRIFNKGTKPTTVTWAGRDLELGVDEFFDTDRAGETLPPGISEFEAAPFLMDRVWLIPTGGSPTAGFQVTTDNVGPVRKGMSLQEASDSLGAQFVIDENLFGCPVALVRHDPYSPIFVLTGEDREAAVIEAILAPTSNVATPPC